MSSRGRHSLLNKNMTSLGPTRVYYVYSSIKTTSTVAMKFLLYGEFVRRTLYLKIDQAEQSRRAFRSLPRFQTAVS
jgi:hypothetical protein